MSEQEDTRRRVLEAAGPLFAERGFDATSVRDITEVARTSPASVNYHFRNKEHLYIETVRLAGESCDRLAPLPVWPAGTPAETRLRDFIRMFLTRALSEAVPAWHRLLIMREISQPRAGACEEFVRQVIRPTFRALNDILVDLAQEPVPSETLHLIGHSIVGQCLHYHHARHVIRMLVGEEEHRTYDIDRLTNHVHAFSLAAIHGLFPTRKGARR